MPRVPIGTYTTSEAIPEFQARLKRLMRDARLNDRQLGQMLGVDGSAIHHWRAGNSRPSLSRVLILCRILGCDPNYLLGVEREAPGPHHWQAGPAAAGDHRRPGAAPEGAGADTVTPAPRRRRQPVAVNPSPVPVMVRRLLRNARLYLHLARLEAASVAAIPHHMRG